MSGTCSTDNGPICPHCGYENDSVSNDYWAEKASSGVDKCDECEKEYSFYVDYTTYYFADVIE